MVTTKVARKMTFDVGWAFLSSAFVMGVGFILKIILGNYFDAEGLGIYSITFSLMNLIIIVTSLALPVAIVKFVAEYQERKNALNSLASTALIIGVLIGIITMATLFFIAPYIETFFDLPNLAHYLRLISLAFPFIIFNNVFISLLNGLRKMNCYAGFELLRNGGILVFTLIFVWQGYGVEGAVLALVIAPPIATVGALIVHSKFFHFRLKNFGKTAKKIFKFGRQLYFANVTSIINAQAATLLIGFYLTDIDVGVYAIVLMFFNFLMMFPMAVQKITYPAISSYFAEKKIGIIKELVHTLLRFSFTFLSLLCLFLLFYVDDLIALVFPGKDTFLMAVQPLRILILLGLMYAVIVPISIVFTSAGRPDVPFKISIVKAATNIGLGIILIPLAVPVLSLDIGHLNGATLAIGSSYIVEVVLFFLMLRPCLGLRIQKKFLAMGISLFALTVIIAYLLVTMAEINENWIGLLLIPIYAVLLFVFGIITKDSLRLIAKVISGKGAV